MADIAKVNAVRDSSTAVTASTGAATQTVVMDGADEKLVLYVKNAYTSALDVTVKAGNGLRSIIGDLVVSVPASSEAVIGPLDSMRFKNLSGTDKGKGVIALAAGTAANIKLTAIQL